MIVRLISPRLRDQGRAWLDRAWLRMRRPVGRGLVAGLVLLLLYGAWPFATLWRLNQAVARGDRATLADLVDLEAVRGEIAHRLNKDDISAIEKVSDPFVEWLEAGIRRHGAEAPRALVTLDWVRDQLGPAASPGLGLLSALTYGFFDDWRDFRTRIDRPAANPLVLRLRLEGGGWRVAMVYY